MSLVDTDRHGTLRYCRPDVNNVELDEAGRPNSWTHARRSIMSAILAINAAMRGVQPPAHQPAPAEPEQPERFGHDDSVKQLLEIMKDVSAEQRARARHLDTKTGTIAGFCATVLTLNVTLGQPLLKSKVAPFAHDVIRLLFLIGSIALGLAAVVAVAGVLRPMDHEDVTEEQIDAYSDRPKVITPPDDLRMTWLRTMTNFTISDRKAADAKSTRARWAAILLTVGLLAVAGEAITLFFAS
jgi:hypothetical protein